MGYDLHITRKEFWADDEGPSIPLGEWQTYVDSDSDIQSDPRNPGPENYLIVSHLEQWPLWWSGGEIFTKNPDKAVVAKLVQIARSLNAKVLGDDDEVYGIDPSDPTIFERR